MRISIVVVIDKKSCGIGFRNTIPWMGKIPRDMKRFRELTTGHPVVMGRKTYASMGHALPLRTNVVLSRSRVLTLSDAKVVNSITEAFAWCNTMPGGNEVFVVGGALVYKEALPFTERMYMTIVNAPFICDVYFPPYHKEEWETIAEECIAPDDKNLFPLHFMTLQRKS